MQKVKANALSNELSAEQRETLDKWLFEEGLSYAVAWSRAQKELGYKGSKTSVHRYFARREKERVLTEFKSLRDKVAAVRSAPEDAESLRAAAMKLLGAFLFEQVKRAPDKVKEWAAVADLILRNDYNEIVRAAKTKEHQIRENAMEFAKKKFEFDTTEQALKALPELMELAQARKDPDTKRYEANAFLNMARRKVAGVVCEVKPESAQEEAEMLAARKAREERKQRQIEWEQREKITGHEPPTPSNPLYAEYLVWKAKKEQNKWRMCAEYEI